MESGKQWIRQSTVDCPYLLIPINEYELKYFHADFSFMPEKLLTSSTLSKNANFQSADSMEYLVSNNAPRERDLGNRENLGQGAILLV